MSIRRTRPQPSSPTDPAHWALLFTRARLRKGWSYIRLSAEAEVCYTTTVKACLTGHCDGCTILKLATALGLMVIPTLSQPLSAHQAQHGR
jgi:hypothetical protein